MSVAAEAPQAPTTEAPAPPAPERPTLSDSFRALRESKAEAPPAPAPEAPANEAETATASTEGDDDREKEGQEAGEADGGEEAVAAAEGAEGAEGAEDGGEGDADEAEEEKPGKDGEPLVLKIPGRRANDADEELELEGLTKEQREGILRMRKGYLRAEQARAVLKKAEDAQSAIEADRAELAEIETALKTDPAAFILGHVGDRKVRSQIVLDHLVDLLDDGGEEATAEYDSIIEQLQQLEADPIRRENHKLKRERAQPKVPKPAEAPASELDPATEREINRVVTAVRGFIPEGTDQATATAYMEDVLTRLQREIERDGLDSVPRELVESIAARYLPAHGLKRPSAKGKQGEPTDPEKGADPAQPAAPPARRADPRETGKALARASARRREAASTPAGGGAPPIAAAPLPKKAGVRDAIAALRQNIRGG